MNLEPPFLDFPSPSAFEELHFSRGKDRKELFDIFVNEANPEKLLQVAYELFIERGNQDRLDLASRIIVCQIEQLKAKVESLQKDLKFAWEEKNREVEEIARSLNWEDE